MKKGFRVLAILVLSCSFVIGVHPFQSHAASSFKTYSYGGGWQYKVYVPSSYTGSSSVPMMVMLHGCSENADDFAKGTGMNQLAEQKNFIVLYPEMNSLYNAMIAGIGSMTITNTVEKEKLRSLEI